MIVTHFICDEYHAWVLMNLSNMTDFRQSNIIYKTNNNQFCFHFSLHLRFRNFVFMKTGSLFECRICWECRGAAQTRSGRPLFIVRPVPTPHEFITPPSACLKHHNQIKSAIQWCMDMIYLSLADFVYNFSKEKTVTFKYSHSFLSPNIFPMVRI